MAENSVILLKNVCKRFGRVNALQNINLEIPAGRIVGLVGGNGAGKTTLLQTILGVHLPTAGEVLTLGSPSTELGSVELQQIGYVAQQDELIAWMRPAQYFNFLAAHYSAWDVRFEEELVSLLEINLAQQIGKMSPGERQRVAIVAALAYRPTLILLDEPAAALDPEARGNLLSILLTLIQSGEHTIVISSHVLSDLEKIVDHLLLLRSGSILVDAELDDIRSSYRRLRITAISGELPSFEAVPGLIVNESRGKQAVLLLSGEGFAAVQSLCQSASCNIEEQPLALEDLYPLLAHLGV